MGQSSGELHTASVLRMRRIMKFMGMLPMWENIFAKVLCNLGLLIVVGVSAYWRFSFEYEFDYDFLNDHFSSTLDLANFVALVGTHLIIVLELLWSNCSKDVEKQLQDIHIEMHVYLGTPMSTDRVRRYCNGIYGSLVIRWSFFLLVTLLNNRALVKYAFYSELVLLARFSEFSLYCAVILFLYEELIVGAANVLDELQRTRFEIWTIRRLSREKLAKIQRIHGSLWQAIRCVERYFRFSLISLLLKFFIDTSALPYWFYLSKVEKTEGLIQHYVAADELIKILEIVLPCYICTLCVARQKKLRSMFYTITTDRRNGQLNSEIRRLNLQLSQERFYFSAGGMMEITNEMLGKFLFGMVSYILICIQFSINFRARNPSNSTQATTPNAQI
ncbi:putative gustatory receptor 98a [Drosophila ficusphila]|uniref:putative gustatory receptor 98a n=1 Tax=Drosophila ficusphila TaxID=30025 RepID=UPI0007E631A4|nr:putative gustatory receptor 98a [Drosophila ficusphila]